MIVIGGFLASNYFKSVQSRLLETDLIAKALDSSLKSLGFEPCCGCAQWSWRIHSYSPAHSQGFNLALLTLSSADLAYNH